MLELVSGVYCLTCPNSISSACPHAYLMFVAPGGTGSSLEYILSTFLTFVSIGKYMSNIIQNIGTAKKLLEIHNRQSKVWALVKGLKELFGFSMVSCLRMSVCWWVFKPQGSCFSLASDLCTLKNTMTFCVWDKSQMPKTKITSTSVNIKTLIYKCKQDQLPRCQQQLLRLQNCGLWAILFVLLCNCVLMSSQSLRSCSRRKPRLVVLPIRALRDCLTS